MEIIGEATKNMSEKFKAAHPDVPWRRVAGMRDKLIHDYFGVNLKIIWDVTQRDLPQLKEKIQAILNE